MPNNLKFWIKLPNCWYYIAHNKNGSKFVWYIWLFGRKWEVKHQPYNGCL